MLTIADDRGICVKTKVDLNSQFTLQKNFTLPRSDSPGRKKAHSLSYVFNLEEIVNDIGKAYIFYIYSSEGSQIGVLAGIS